MDLEKKVPRFDPVTRRVNTEWIDLSIPGKYLASLYQNDEIFNRALPQVMWDLIIQFTSPLESVLYRICAIRASTSYPYIPSELLDPEFIRIEKSDSVISIQPPYCYVEWKGRWSRGVASFDGIDVSFVGLGSSFHVCGVIDPDVEISWEEIATRSNRAYQTATAHYDYLEDIDSFEVPMNSWSNALNQHLKYGWTVDDFRPTVRPPPPPSPPSPATSFAAVIRHEPTRLWIVSDWAKTCREIEYIRNISRVLIIDRAAGTNATGISNRFDVGHPKCSLLDVKDDEGRRTLIFQETQEQIRAVFYSGRLAEGVLSICTCPEMRPARLMASERIHRLNARECPAYAAGSLFFVDDLRWTGEFAKVQLSDRGENLTPLEAYNKFKDLQIIWIWWVGLWRWRHAQISCLRSNVYFLRVGFGDPSIPYEDLNLSLKSVRNRICCFPSIP